MSSEVFELTRVVTIRMIHHLWNPTLSDHENARAYGICTRRHGHHIQVQVTLQSTRLDADSGLIFSRDSLDAILKQFLVDPYDGVDFNRHFANTAGEALAKEFYMILAPRLPNGLLKKVAVYESRGSYFEYQHS